ncbi:MAG: PA14 domain-containing protein [Candidatus Woesebacteria bacterium GW2011_GWB1_39_12]|uniref:PA14 domain-containing protein n=2 Tax=Candidatus Woeseibacteriota TaxID=1752722 RepID=A0A0G0MBB2_9BACT|nr:MAG: PA14 domain-containing protein [Candidatus Woesebacteria bacterium GW2011_GWA1_39_12]KKR01167.1 MAG: PA14 domain-containing protein [Candidatus Woesebacteria bacterium GW2011_GWB1_39_12]
MKVFSSRFLSFLTREEKIIFAYSRVFIPLLILILSVSLVVQQKSLDIRRKAITTSVPVDPQYILLNKTPTGCPPGTTQYCWFPQDPNTIDARAVDEIRQHIPTNGTTNRKLGLSFSVWLLDLNRDVQIQDIDKLLNIAVTKDIPIYIRLDGFTWWENRPDLWNWWDPNLPGYNPSNRYNVEWTSWNPDSAIKISWRNWGAQFRVKPQPNLGSRVYIDAKKTALETLIPRIVNWYNNLPNDKKYLLAGVEIDNELSIGTNFYYYPNGNNYLNQNSQLDPNLPADWSQLDGGYVQLGYAAMSSYGYPQNTTPTKDILNHIMSLHMNDISNYVASLGLPRNKFFTHGIGTPYYYTHALTQVATPGWSFYDYAYNPSLAPDFPPAVNELDNTPWGAVEWWNMNSNVSWQTAFNNTLNYDNNKIVNIFSYESITFPSTLSDAIINTLNTPPSCWLNPAVLNPTVTDGTNTTLSWSTPNNAMATYLNVSNNPDRLSSGSLRYLNVINENVTGRTSYTKTLTAGTYYWQVVVDGCQNSSNMGAQRRITPGKFTVGSSDYESQSPTPSVTPYISTSPTPTTSPMPQLSGTGLMGYYYSGKDFQAFKIARIDAQVNFNWGISAPSSNIGSDNFAVRWVGQVETPVSGDYIFSTRSDDGLRLFINNQLIINQWNNHSPTDHYGGAIRLEAGKKYNIILEYYENTGGSTIQLYWSYPNQVRQIIPQQRLYNLYALSNGGLRGNYYSGIGYGTLRVSNIDSQVNYNWGLNSPNPALSTDYFSILWLGQITPPTTGLYTFYTNTDDGVRLFVNNQLLINNWTVHSPFENTASVYLEGGKKYNLLLEYYENQGGASIQLSWSYPGQTKQIIPTTGLFR